MKVLIVEDDESSRSYLETAVSGQGYEVELAVDGRMGLEKFKQFDPDLVLSDIRMPNMDGLQLLADIRKIRSDVIVVIMTGYGSETYALQALELKANDYLCKPIRHQNLIAILRKYAESLPANQPEENIPGLTQAKSSQVEFSSLMKLVPTVVDKLVDEVKNLVDEDGLLGIRLGLIELITNAIEHGNLGISYDEKSETMEDGGTIGIDALIHAREESSECREKKVTIDFVQQPKYVEWVIRDEGKGFDWKELEKKSQEGDSILSLHGRGIFLSRFQFDELEYEGVGNVVRIRKYLTNSPEQDSGADQ